MDGSATGSDHTVAATAAGAVDAPTDAPTAAADAPTAAPTATVDAPMATADETDTDVDGEWIIFQDVAEMFAWDPYPVHGIHPSSYASLLLAQEVAGRSETVGASFDFGADMTEQEEVAATQAEIHEVRDRGWWDNTGESRGPNVNDPMGGAIQTSVTAMEGGRRWVRKAKRTRRNQRSLLPSAEGGGGSSDDMAVVEEVSSPQRFSIHFHHVMVRGATLAKEGRTMTAEDVEAELALSTEHWASDHSRCARHGIVPRAQTIHAAPKKASEPPKQLVFQEQLCVKEYAPWGVHWLQELLDRHARTASRQTATLSKGTKLIRDDWIHGRRMVFTLFLPVLSAAMRPP
ncbi:unnamed protein product [Closterium sp. NIES-64]|nr:unnamed protein product [Closterium sp. NIES-64]